jgi:WD40 repeat protein
MQNMKCVAVLLGIALTAPTSAAQECKKTARSQIEAVLDKSTNRILLSEVVNDFGEEGKGVLVEIAGDESQSSKRRGEAIRLLGEYRSDAGERLLLEMLRDHKTACGVINALQEYRSREIVPAFIALLDDHRSCGSIVRFNAGGQGKQDQTEVFVSDEAVGGLERLTNKRFEKERDLFVIGHRATQPWKDWWSENRDAFLADSSRFLTPPRNIGEHEDSYPCSVVTVAISPDNKIAFSAGKSYDPWVRAWNIDTRQQLWATHSVKDDDATSSVFSADGRVVAMGTSNGAVKVFDADTGRQLRLLIIGSAVDSVAFSPDGTVLALGSDDGIIRLIDTKSWCEREQIDNSDMTEGIAFSPDGSLLAAATFGRVRLWNVATAAELRRFQVRPATPPTVFADVGERQAQLWRMAWRVAFSPDGTLLASGSSSAVQLWNPTTGQEVASSPSNGQVGSLHFSADGQWVVWGNDRDEIVRWNPSKKKRLHIKNQFSLGDTAMTPDGRLIFSPGAGTQIAIFDLQTRRKVGALECKKTAEARP